MVMLFSEGFAATGLAHRHVIRKQHFAEIAAVTEPSFGVALGWKRQ
jgi:hypothetical protein